MARIAPMVSSEKLLRSLPTEDGYLMLTIARNLALGHGLSTAAGTMPTNGTQPLMAGVWALGFRAVGGAKVEGVFLALVIQLVLASLAARSLYLLGRTLLGDGDRGRRAAALGTAAWYAAALTVMHGMNCLETGAYALVVIVFSRAFLHARAQPIESWSRRRAILLGLLLGLAFWIRVDAVFLALAACASCAAVDSRGRVSVRGEAVATAALMGAVAAIVAAPWVAYGVLRFGSPIPTSGIAQSWSATFGQDLRPAVVHLAEYALVVAPIPSALEGVPIVVAACAVVVALVVMVLVRVWARGCPRTRIFLSLIGAYGLLLSTYYAFFFGAPHFVGRYLFPLSPFLALLWAERALAVWSLPWVRRSRAVAVALSVALISIVAYPNLRHYRRGDWQQHFQIVEWVEANVPTDAWVGAIQTGTLGFFHDRTINLDGKVNPAALEAARAGRTEQYVLSQPIAYLADWSGIAAWAELPVLGPHFDLIVHDEARNLAVLRRKVGDGYRAGIN